MLPDPTREYELAGKPTPLNCASSIHWESEAKTSKLTSDKHTLAVRFRTSATDSGQYPYYAYP